MRSGRKLAAEGGDHAPRVLPANAVQPPGASFEQNTTGKQKALLVKDLLRATASQVASEPLGAMVIVPRRPAERIGGRLAESVPRLPIPPAHQSPRLETLGLWY